MLATSNPFLEYADQVARGWPYVQKPLVKPPVRRRSPSLAALRRQARNAGLDIAAMTIRSDGTRVLHFTHNLHDNHSPAIQPDENEWDEVLQ